MTAVCDLWKVNREKATATNATYYGRNPRAVQYAEELLSMKDIDAVLIATPAHWHATMAVMAAQAGKDIYCEKPTAGTVREARAVHRP